MQALAWALSVRGLPPGEWRLLVMLANRVGKRGFDVWPSYGRMAEDCEIGHSTARRYIQTLLSRELIQIVGMCERKNGGTGVNIYRLQVGSSMSIPGQDPVHYDPEFNDDEEHDPMLDLSRGGARFEQGSMLTGEHCTNEPLKTEPTTVEDSPLPPLGGDTEDDLFGGSIPVGTVEELLCEHFAKGWAELVSRRKLIPAITKFSDDRRKKLIKRLDEHDGLRGLSAGSAVIDRVLAAIDGSPWLCLEQKHWGFNVDWLLKSESNFRRTMERLNERNHVDGSVDPGSTVRAAQSAFASLGPVYEQRRAARFGDKRGPGNAGSGNLLPPR